MRSRQSRRATRASNLWWLSAGQLGRQPRRASLVAVQSMRLIGAFLLVALCCNHLHGTCIPLVATQSRQQAKENSIATDGQQVSISRSILVLDPARNALRAEVDMHHGQSDEPINQLVQFEDSSGDATKFGEQPQQIGQPVEVEQASDNNYADGMQPQTSGQFEDPIGMKRVDVSLFQQLTNRTNSNKNQSDVYQLNEDFLSLFDELWRLKNSSVNTLVRLEYFPNKTALSNSRLGVGDAPDMRRTNNNNKLQCLQYAGANGKSTSCGASDAVPQPTIMSNGQQMLRLPTKFEFSLKTSSTKPPNNPNLARVAATRLGEWLATAQKRAQQMLNKLCNAFKTKQSILLAKVGLAQHRGAMQQQRQQWQGQQASNINLSHNISKIVDEIAGAPSSEPGGAQESALVYLHAEIPIGHGQEKTSKARIRRQAFPSFSRANNGREQFLGEQEAPVDNQPQAQLQAQAQLIGDEQQQQQQQQQQTEQICVNLTIDELSNCRSIESSVNSLLNHSFPGTLASIEDNCRKITFLLANCWPSQLDQLRFSLASWNESVVAASEFALPGTRSRLDFLSGGGPSSLASMHHAQPSCGSGEPQSPAIIRDRVSWMWLNLCMDKKFRLDYVQNLRCLSAWNQERAQQVCSNEYKQMHGYMQHQAEINAAASVAAAAAAQSTSNVRTQLVPAWQASGSFLTSAQTQSLQQQQQAQTNYQALRALEKDQMESREVGSKMLCCMFDQFLRCVHRQAVRDCGRPGAQFVVNFMSRIGDEDMKYLCNGEPRHSSSSPRDQNQQRQQDGQYAQRNTQQQYAGGGGGGFNAGSTSKVGLSSSISGNLNHQARVKTQSGGRKSNHQGQHHHDRSPFIDGNYCTDSRIQSALHNVSLLYGDPHRGRQSSSSSPSSGSNSAYAGSSRLQNTPRTKIRAPINHDPTYLDDPTQILPTNASSRDNFSVKITSLALFICIVLSYLSMSLSTNVVI